MEQIIVTHSDYTQFPLNSNAQVSAVTQAIQSVSLLGEDVINITVVSATKLDFRVNDTITVYGREYFLTDLPNAKKNGERNFEYTLQFKGMQYRMMKTQLRDYDSTGVSVQGGSFSLMADLRMFVDLIVRNLCRMYGVGTWVVGECPDGTEYKNLTFDNENCLQALQNLCSADNYDTEFDIQKTGNVFTLNIKKIGTLLPYSFQYGRGRGLYDITRQSVDNKQIITRLFADGGDKNIPSDYRNAATRLQLPLSAITDDNNRYIQDNTAIQKFGVIEAAQTFDEYYPHREGTVTALGGSILSFVDDTMDFDLAEKDSEGQTKYLISGTSAKISFKTGGLAGYEFELNKIAGYVHTTKTFTLLKYTDDRGLVFPNADSAAFQIAVGDKYTILDINMPQSYIDNAEAQLLAAAQEYYSQNCKSRVQFSVTVDKNYISSYAGTGSIINFFSIGDTVHVVDDDLNLDGNSRITAYTRNLLTDYDYTLTLGDDVAVNVITNLIAQKIETAKVLKINNLIDPARARRSYKSTQELLNMVFDTDGYFDGTNIKPESIETGMLSVGAKSEQFMLKNVVIEANQDANPNLVSVSGGQLVHFSIADNIVTWLLSASENIELTSSGAYYIYARCQRDDNIGSIIFSQDAIKFDTDANFYHFRIGVLHSIIDNVRWVSLTYGSTTINGKFITTGKITSTDGSCWYDLDGNSFKLGNDQSGIDWNVTNENKLTITGGLIQREAGVAAAPIPVYRGTWNADVTYYAGDSAYYNGSTYNYIAATPSSGHAVTDGAYWQVSAAKGADGQDGQDGAPGANGAKGDKGDDGLGVNENLFPFKAWANKLNTPTNATQSVDLSGLAITLTPTGNPAWTNPWNTGADGIAVEPNTQYTLSLDRSLQNTNYYMTILFCDTEMSYWSTYIEQVTDKVTFTTSETTHYMLIRLTIINEVGGECIFSKFKLEKGTAATAYLANVDDLKGEDGTDGLQGAQGTPGAPGADGVSSYIHIAYADDASGNGFSQSNSGKKYIGIYKDTNAADSNNPNDYTWSKYIGENGAQGIPGAPGADGLTPYTHFAYADDANGAGFSQSPSGKAYMGVYTDFTEADSNNPDDYVWSLIKGADATVNYVKKSTFEDGLTTGWDDLGTHTDGVVDVTGQAFTKAMKWSISDLVESNAIPVVPGELWKCMANLNAENANYDVPFGVIVFNSSMYPFDYVRIINKPAGTGWGMLSNNYTMPESAAYIKPYCRIEGPGQESNGYALGCNFFLTRMIKGDAGADGTPGQDGTNGQDGAPGNYTELRFAKNGSKTEAPALTVTDTNPAGWDVVQPATNLTEYLWMTSAQKSGATGALLANWSAPVRTKGADGADGADGANGSAGASVLYKGVYDAAKTYTGSDKFIDAVKYNDTYYVARTDAGTFTNTLPTDTSKWNAYGSNFESVATGLLLAEQATVDNLTVRQVAAQTGTTPVMSMNANNDSMFKINHPNGAVGLEMGVFNGILKMVFFDEYGNKLWEMGKYGIYMQYTEASWEESNASLVSGSLTESATNAQLLSIDLNLYTPPDGTAPYDTYIVPSVDADKYDAGLNETSATNEQYNGYHTSKSLALNNWLPDGWYILNAGEGTGNLFTPTSNPGAYTITYKVSYIKNHLEITSRTLTRTINF